MKNIILVEGKDNFFIQRLIQGIVVKPMGGLNNLTMELNILKNSFPKTPYEKLGIILDQDIVTKSERLIFVNKCLQDVFGIQSSENDKVTPNIQLSDTQIFSTIEIQEIPLQIACYFVNVNGVGELETLLRLIKTQLSPYSDCLQEWQNCLTEKVSQKEFDKLWVHYYIKHDTATRKERKQADQLTFENSLKKNPPIWDFNSPILDELKGFLALFEIEHITK